jgi:predicted esterase
MKNNFLFVVTLLFVSTSFSQSINTKLPSLNIDQSNITVSGVSSGGYMAVQLHVALSTVFKGAASVAGGPYWCSEGNSTTAQDKCMKHPEKIKTETSINQALAEAKAGAIENLSNLKNSKVYIFSSPTDTVLPKLNSDRLYEFYANFIPKNQIVYQNTINAGHSWVTNSYGSSCATEGPPFINNCNYDMAGDILKLFYGNLNGNLNVSRSPRAVVNAQLYQFDQTEFQTQNSALYSFGYIYVPKACMEGRRNVRMDACKLHVALHGCLMNPGVIQDKFAVNSGLNTWAEANNIVILYPQASAVAGNPYGCWDWFGYTDKKTYANRNGPQIIAIQKMVYRLLGKF